MVRYKVGEHILVRRMDWDKQDPIEVKILDRAPNHIKVEVLSSGWFQCGSIHWLCTGDWTNEQWYSITKV